MSRRIRVMVVVPENNTTMEPEIAALCPALAPIPVARVKRPARTLLLEDLPAYAEATLDAIAPFAGRAVRSRDLWLHRRRIPRRSRAAMPAWWTSLRERTGATVVSTAGAMIDALRKRRRRRDRGGDALSRSRSTTACARYLESSGIAVETLNSFFCKTTAELGRDHRRRRCSNWR